MYILNFKVLAKPGSYISIAKDYFQQPIEHYYYINNIPAVNFFGLSDHFYFYAIIFLGFSLFLILTGISLIQQKSKPKHPITQLPKYLTLKFPITQLPKYLTLRFPITQVPKYLIYFILIVWLITSVRWLSVQARWIKNDLVDFKGHSITERQSKAVDRLIRTKNLPANWYGFYDFLEFGKRKIPADSSIYLLPADPTFWVRAKYWLAPDLRLVDSSKIADYIISFNVDLPDQVKGFKEFKEFGPNKLILIKYD